MSFLKIRADWLNLSRQAAASEEDRLQVVVSATFTADPIAPFLGMRLVEDASPPPMLTIAPYNQIFQLCHEWPIAYPDKQPDAVVILWRIEDLSRPRFQAFLHGGGGDPLMWDVDELADAIARLRSAFKGTIVVSIPPYPHSPDHHIRSLRSASEAGALHRRVVDRWIERMGQLENISLLDLDGLQRYVGIQNSVDWRKWYLYRQPYTEAFWNEIGEAAASLVSNQRSAAKKCVVVDCDNTLWGGIVGEDGLSGLAIGEDFPGSAFRDFQNQLVALRSQGVIIALCSKNNEADVWEVFDNHDGMALKREHVVAHRINWTDKPSNIASIAQELNIGLDSMVFVDDSPMEIEHVRSSLPMVTCVQVPSDTSAFTSLFGAYRGFDREKVTAEDRARSDMMLQERQRRELATQVDGDDFRKALQLVVDVFEVRAEHVARVVQLINKTNQFNLTTRRKTQSDIAALLDSPDAAVLAWRVADRFGDYGLVGVGILNFVDQAAEIETLLMSCRVLGRGVENAVFAALSEFVRTRGAQRLVGEFLQTSKNQLVASLYADHSFAEIGFGRWAHDDLDGLRWPEGIERPGL